MPTSKNTRVVKAWAIKDGKGGLSRFNENNGAYIILDYKPLTGFAHFIPVEIHIKKRKGRR